MNQNQFEHESRLIIKNQHFPNESSLAKYKPWGVFPGICFPRISFVNCTFEKLSLSATVFGSCRFQNCRFNNFNARKATFSGCQFENCQITNSEMTRAEFSKTSFTNCNFLAVNLRASNFFHCKFKRTRFLKSNLELLGIEDVKVWESNQWVEIDDDSSFEKHFDK